ncbi:MAG: DUF134 domain-containing protein [Actinobacteria bacterium]|nr:DUF134 domain-containing protein [Actinomycetota bacterium]MBU1943512.1 DUF134 domain-containing protein [Actinomycetota bacterium]MBU2686471.1 DUF134 domain-containing protein [Actinomycetota bacterium]
MGICPFNREERTLPRPRKPRFVAAEPGTRYFKPQGIPLRELESVILSVEELEAVRLVDEEGLYQEAAAERMEVSRQTFQRILRGARRKVADALVNGKALGIEGGDYVLAEGERVFECTGCGHRWEVPFGTGVRAREASCPKCGGPVVRAGGGRGFGARRGGGSRGRWGSPGSAGESRKENGRSVDDDE